MSAQANTTAARIERALASHGLATVCEMGIVNPNHAGFDVRVLSSDGVTPLLGEEKKREIIAALENATGYKIGIEILHLRGFVVWVSS